MTTIDIVFDDSDIEEEENLDDIDDDIDDDIVDESSEEEEDDDKDSISFESEEEIDDDEGDEGGDVGDEGGDVGDEGGDVGGIDISEFYDETPKKSTKATFNKRKRNKPLKVAKTKRNKKKKGVDDIIIPNYIMEDVREKTSGYLKKFITEKNSISVERAIYNYTVRGVSVELGRPVKKTDLGKDVFKKMYSLVSYEIISCIVRGVNGLGVKCKEIIANLESNKIGIKSDAFRNEHFNDKQETNNIENPPRVMRGIHTCSKCVKDGSKKDDPDRGKRVDWYQQQTRSCDEPMTVFCKCTDCGHKWKF